MPGLSLPPRLGLFVAALAVGLSACVGARPGTEQELVVLVHGMGRTALSMAPMEIAMRRAGYRVLNVGYSSQRPSVAEIGQQLADAVHAETDRHPTTRVHVVGHSLGTVVTRWMLVHDPPEVPGRVVMLAPPNQGAHSADRWARWIGWSLPPIRDLQTTGGPALALGIPDDTEVAVIAGDRDGKVGVEETCLEGAAHVVVPSRHTFIMMRPRVIGLVRTFLASGDLPGASSAACAEVLN